jgi:hypothetical protein
MQLREACAHSLKTPRSIMTRAGIAKTLKRGISRLPSPRAESNFRARIIGNNMRFLRHLGRLMKEFFGFAWHHKAWWIVPMIIILLLMTILIFCTQSLAPFIYTLY